MPRGELILPTSDAPPFRLVNMVMIGLGAAGKSCVLDRFTKDSFIPGRDITIGVELSCRFLEFERRLYKLTVRDTASQKRFDVITKPYLKRASVVLFCISACGDSFEDIEARLNDFLPSIRDDNPLNPPILLVANKIDREDSRAVSSEQLAALTEKYGLTLVQCSAKTGVGVEEVFTKALELHVRQLEQQGLLPRLLPEPKPFHQPTVVERWYASAVTAVTAYRDSQRKAAVEKERRRQAGAERRERIARFKQASEQRDQAAMLAVLQEDSSVCSNRKELWFWAASLGFNDILAFLYSHRCEFLNLTNVSARTALMCAAQAGQVATVEWLKSKGADIQIRDKRGRDARYYFIRHNPDLIDRCDELLPTARLSASDLAVLEALPVVDADDMCSELSAAPSSVSFSSVGTALVLSHLGLPFVANPDEALATDDEDDIANIPITEIFQACQAQLADEPDNTDLVWVSAKLQIRVGNFADAVTSLSRLLSVELELQQRVYALRDRARCYYCLGQYQTAHDDFKEALTLSTDLAEDLPAEDMVKLKAEQRKAAQQLKLEHERERRCQQAQIEAFRLALRVALLGRVCASYALVGEYSARRQTLTEKIIAKAQSVTKFVPVPGLGMLVSGAAKAAETFYDRQAMQRAQMVLAVYCADDDMANTTEFFYRLTYEIALAFQATKLPQSQHAELINTIADALLILNKADLREADEDLMAFALSRLQALNPSPGSSLAVVYEHLAKKIESETLPELAIPESEAVVDSEPASERKALVA